MRIYFVVILIFTLLIHVLFTQEMEFERSIKKENKSLLELLKNKNASESKFKTQMKIFQRSYTGLWRPGKGGQRWHTGIPFLQLLKKDEDYFKKGLRLMDIEIANGSYSGVWQPGSGGRWWQTGMSLSQFKAKDKTYFNQGLRLVDVEIALGSKHAGARYAAIWRPGKGAQWWSTGITFSQLKAKDKYYFKKGLRLIDMEVVNGGYTAVWRPGKGAQWWSTGITFSQLQTKDIGYFKQGLRIVDVEIVNGKYTAIWRPGKGTQWLWAKVHLGDYKMLDKGYYGKNLRMMDLEVSYDPPVGIYRLPFDEGNGWSWGRGNWDDPIAGHSKGNPNGPQKYAYDFLHAIGGKVRAAREGRVIFVENNYGNNLDASAPNFDPNAPGYGTAILIRHSDGTVAAYDHLKYLSTKVVKGQFVKKGEEIALSGHTGSSTTPHLHFDLREYWNSETDFGPTIPIRFKTNSYRCRRLKVGDDL